MKTLLIFIAFATLLCGIQAVPCSNNTDCDSCTMQKGCGWCAPTKSCLEGSKLGPNNSICAGSAWEFLTCTPCAQFLDCRTCSSRDTDCFWCPNTNGGAGACKNLGFTCTAPPQCPCDVFASCTECINDPNCQWCGDGNNCQNISTTCPGPQPTYNFTTTCPCDANRDCTNCLQTNGCEWCVTG